MSHGETGIMSNDRDARRTESLVELFDRFFFCRSFHSKLFPFGGFAKARTPKARTSKAKTPGYTRRPAPPDPETTVSRPSDVTTFSSLPSRLPRPDGHLAPGSRFEPNPLLSAHGAKSEIRFSPIYAGHTIKPLNKHLFAAGACSLGQDGIINTIPGNSPRNGPKTPVRTNQQTGAPPSRTMRNGHGEGTRFSCLVGFWKANAKARTEVHASGARCLTNLCRVAKP